jgi:hypothetical protein
LQFFGRAFEKLDDSGWPIRVGRAFPRFQLRMRHLERFGALAAGEIAFLPLLFDTVGDYPTTSVFASRYPCHYSDMI